MRLCNYPAYQRLELLEYLTEKARTTDEAQEILSVFEDDPDPIVRHEAAAQLIRLERENPNVVSPLKVKIREALIRGPQDKSVVIRHEALESLAYIGDESTLEILQASIGDANPDVSNTAKLAYEVLAFRLKHNLKPSELSKAFLSSSA